MIHPSLVQRVVLDGRTFTRALADEIKRSYLYVGPVSVSSRAAADACAPVCNTMRMVVCMARPYWRSCEPGADELWPEVLAWLKGKLYKVGSTMVNYNKSRAEKGLDTLGFDRLELDMKGVTFGFALPNVDELPAVEVQVERFRTLLNEGAFGEGLPAAVELPSRQSYAAQLDRARAAAPEQTDAVAPAPAPDAGQGDEAQPAGQACLCAAGEAPAPDPCEAAAAGLPVVDYAVWDVTCADGSVRQFDSVAGAWL